MEVSRTENNNLVSGTATELRTTGHADLARPNDKSDHTAETLPSSNLQVKERAEAERGQKHDYFGHTVIKGQKQHKITFRDIISGQRIADVKEVESYKEYNVLTTDSSAQCSCKLL